MAGVALQKTFKAWLDKMPMANNTLHVTGEIEFPTLGYRASLVMKEPQGINPLILFLEVKVTPPAGQAAQQITKVPVRFDKPHSSDYQSVEILGAGPVFSVGVSITQ